MTYITEDQPETAMLAAEQAAISGNIESQQPETIITGKLAKDITQQACARWNLKQAQWYKWMQNFEKPQKTEDGLMLTSEQIALFDGLRSHLNEGGTYASYQELLDKETVVEIVLADVSDENAGAIAQECAEAEFTEEVERRGIPRAIQEKAFMLRATEYRLAARIDPEELDPDLQEALKREEADFVGKLNRRRSPEEMEGAIASMMNLLAA